MKDILKIDKMYEKKNMANVREYIVGILSLLFSVAVAWITIPKIVDFINPVTMDMAQIKSLFPNWWIINGYVCPEPIEKAMFITAIVLLPILLLVFIFLFNYIIKNITNLSAIEYFYNVLSIVFLGLIVYLVWITNEKRDFVYFINGIGIGIKTIFFVAIISILINLLILSAQKNHASNKFLKIVSILTNSICWVAILSIVLFAVYDISIVSDMHTKTYSDNFNVVFHPVVQVFLGKQILYDLVSQYGLFPHILEPVWRIVGLSVFKFTLVMGLLVGLSLFLLYKFFKESINNKIIAYLGFLSVVWSSYMWHKVLFMYRWPPSFNDPIFQIWPVRVLFPIISIYFTYRYFKTPSKKMYYLLFVTYSISMIWNFDTGLVVYLTWLMTLVYEGLCNRDIKKTLFHILNWGLILLLTIGSCMLYMCLKYGHLPVYEKFIWFQKTYYIYGFFMLPMPLIHPWNLVIVIYLIGIVISLINLLKGNKSPEALIIFNLSILGAGLFSYYQGRSHDFTFTSPCYPAVVMITVFADGLIEKIKNRRSIMSFIALNYITFFVVYSSISFIKNYKIIYTTIRERITVSFRNEDTPITRSAKFIEDNTKRGEEVLLISGLSGIYHLESRTTSPINIVTNHIVLNNQIEYLRNYLNSDSCKRVFLDVNCIGNDAIWLDFVRKNFKLSIVSQDKNIGLFIK